VVNPDARRFPPQEVVNPGAHREVVNLDDSESDVFSSGSELPMVPMRHRVRFREENASSSSSEDSNRADEHLLEDESSSEGSNHSGSD
jgi:hypothetical protein